MGDRAVIVFHTKDMKEFSPSVYSHWGGADIPKDIESLKTLMGTREEDIQYACARFIGILHAQVPDRNTGLGVWNTPNTEDGTVRNWVEKDWEGYSQGDAGVFLVNASDFTWKCFGGYYAAYNQDDWRNYGQDAS